VVPETPFGFVMVMDEVPPEQIVWLADALTSGIDFTIGDEVLADTELLERHVPDRFVIVTATVLPG
jgi:hypothetical protein